MAEQSSSSALRRPLWASFLILASLTLSAGLSCAVPLAAFAAVASLTLGRRDAFALIGAVWLANQITGFAIHHYPLTASTLFWGAVLGFVALASTLTAQLTKNRLAQGELADALIAFLSSFAVYEGALFAISAALGSGLSDYAPSIVARIFAINAAAFAALGLMQRLPVFTSHSARLSRAGLAAPEC